MLTRWDPQGEIVWQRKSHYGYYATTYDLEVLPDGSLLGAAFSAEAGRNAMLCKFSSTGDSLWTRGYQVTQGPHYMYGLERTGDGGFVATGEGWRKMPDDSAFQSNQVIWVLRTDSLGCMVPGCHTVGVEEYLPYLNGHLRAWPNPVARGTPLRLGFDPPPDFEAKGPLRAVLLDAAGRVVQEHAMPGRELLLPSAGLPAGLYHLHLTDGHRWLAGAKVVVE